MSSAKMLEVLAHVPLCRWGRMSAYSEGELAAIWHIEQVAKAAHYLKEPLTLARVQESLCNETNDEIQRAMVDLLLGLDDKSLEIIGESLWVLSWLCKEMTI